MHTIEVINITIVWLFVILNIHQFFYIAVSLLHKPSERPSHKNVPLHRYAFLVAARNESAVIGNLLDSIRNQDYPSELYDIYVVADNCTDNTAAICALHGAHVYEREDQTHVGKGYAVNYLLHEIPMEQYDAFLVFDADNILESNYLSEINHTYSEGYEIITSYRNSKNFGDNWISAGYALCFLRESRHLNYPRNLLGASASVTGTGFMVSRKTLERCGGWHYYLLVEDLQFSIDRITNGQKIGYCHKAMFYDEQPTSFRQSWRQRLRWSKGYLQVLRNYGMPLLRGIFKGNYSCYDMLMNIAPSFALSIIGIVLDSISLVKTFLLGRSLEGLAYGLLKLVIGLCLTVFIVGLVTMITEWKKILCKPWKKIFFTLTFPVFMLTYLPIAAASLFQKVEWKPITHTKSVSLEDIKKD